MLFESFFYVNVLKGEGGQHDVNITVDQKGWVRRNQEIVRNKIQKNHFFIWALRFFKGQNQNSAEDRR